jgi:rubrerythrin
MVRKSDFLAWIEFFVDDERHAIEEYAKFLSRLPDDPRFDPLRSMIRDIMKDEEAHFTALRELYKAIAQDDIWEDYG